MKIWIKPYLRRDGSVMFFLNNDRKVSLGLTPENGYESSKASAGQKKLWETFCRATRESAALAEGADMTGHSEFKMTLFNGITFAMTDTATIGGFRWVLMDFLLSARVASWPHNFELKIDR